jgi:hypothetical protein
MDYIAEIPGDNDIHMKVNDTLRIHFKNSAKFCIDSGNKDAFNPSLPVNQTEPAGWWPAEDVSKAARAILETTIAYCHADPKEGCKPCKTTENGPGTIKVGSGTK